MVVGLSNQPQSEFKKVLDINRDSTRQILLSKDCTDLFI